MCEQITKDEALFRHAALRLATRYGAWLTPELHDYLVDRLKAMRTPGIKQSCRKYVACISNNRKTYYVIWDRKRECIVTFLTQQMYEKLAHKERQSMLCYKDMTYCGFMKCKAKYCHRRLTRTVVKNARELGLPIAKLTDKPECFQVRRSA